MMGELQAVNEILNGSNAQQCNQGVPQASMNGQLQPGPPMTNAQWDMHVQHALCSRLMILSYL